MGANPHFLKFSLKKQKIQYICSPQTVGIAQLVRAPDCGSGGRRFEPGYLPEKLSQLIVTAFFIVRSGLRDPLTSNSRPDNSMLERKHQREEAHGHEVSLRKRCKGFSSFATPASCVAKNRSEAEPDAARPDACLLRKGAPNIQNQNKPIFLIPFLMSYRSSFLPFAL